MHQFAAKLLFTTKDAVVMVYFNGSSAWNDVVRIGNLSNPRSLTHDFRGGYIFWCEELDVVTVKKKKKKSLYCRFDG